MLREEEGEEVVLRRKKELAGKVRNRTPTVHLIE
jgi:hypothetical protein